MVTPSAAARVAAENVRTVPETAAATWAIGVVFCREAYFRSGTVWFPVTVTNLAAPSSATISRTGECNSVVDGGSGRGAGGWAKSGYPGARS